jgi:N-acyl-D-aspartate/D-glutamate deacylase
LLIPGMKADVIVFDPATVGDRATYDKPHQYSVGVNEVIVNGKLVLHEGKVTSERPGKVLLGPAAR